MHALNRRATEPTRNRSAIRAPLGMKAAFSSEQDGGASKCIKGRSRFDRLCYSAGAAPAAFGAGERRGLLVAATGWLPHTTRAALTGLRKRGYAVGTAGRSGDRGTEAPRDGRDHGVIAARHAVPDKRVRRSSESAFPAACAR